jgi:spectinomycin phosphotransferase
MFEDPFVDPERIVTALHGVRLSRARLAALLGADPDTVVHRAVAANGRAYFVKLRRGVFDEASVTVPRFLADLGVAQIIEPVPTRTGRPWAQLGGLRMIVYPFVDGRSALEVPFTDRHWIELGAGLARIHRAVLPRALAERLQRETYTGRWRELAKGFVERGAAGELGAAEAARRDSRIVMRAGNWRPRFRRARPGSRSATPTSTRATC